MGRLSDALSAIFLGYATLHHFERNRGAVKGLEALAESALLQLESEAQEAMREASENFPRPLGAVGGWLMSAGLAPLGGLMRPYRPPKDHLTQEVARLLTTPSEVHGMFTQNLFVNHEDADHRVGALLRAMPICLQADAILADCKKAKRSPSADETETLARAEALRHALVQVDVSEAVGPLEAQEGYVRPAIASTEERLAGAAANFEAATARAAASA